LAKNAAQMVTLFALSNLWMARRHLLAGRRRGASVVQKMATEGRSAAKKSAALRRSGGFGSFGRLQKLAGTEVSRKYQAISDHP